MRLLVDACVPRPVTDALREAGHDVLDIAQQGPDPGDPEILRRSVDENRILITADADFAELAVRHRHAHHGIIQLPQLSFPIMIAIVAGVLAAHAEEELAQSVVIAKETRVRVLRVIPGRS